MSVQNAAFNGTPSQFFDKEAWLNIIVCAYNFLSASTALAQALDNKYSTAAQLTESTSKHEVDAHLDECPSFINMITKTTPTEISLQNDDEKLEVEDLSPNKELNHELLKQNEMSFDEDIDEKLDLPDILTTKTVDHDFIEFSPVHFADYKHLPYIPLDNLNNELYFPEIEPNNVVDNKLELSDISLNESSNLQLIEISSNEIVDEKLDLADISLNKILNYDTLPNKEVDCELITKYIHDTQLLNINGTANVHTVAKEEISKDLCSELNVFDETSTRPVKSIINIPESLNIDSIINTALDTLCLLEAAILDIEHSEQTPCLLNLINNDPFQERKSANQNRNILLTKSDDLKDSYLTDLESITNTHSQSESTINSAAMDTLDTTIDTTVDTNPENTDNNDQSNLGLSVVGSDRMIEIDIGLQKIINDTTKSKSKSESKEEINEIQPTVNRRFEGTLKAQIFKQPEIQRELLEYSREQNPQKTIDFPASIQKLKSQLDKISEEGKNANQRKLYNNIVHISDMVTQLEYEHEEHLKNNPIAHRNIINKNRVNNLASKKNSRPSSLMKKNKSNLPMQLPIKSQNKTEEISTATKPDAENKVKKNKIQSLKKKQALVKPEPVPNLRMLDGILNAKFVNTVNEKIAKRNLKGYINLTNVEAIIPKSKTKKRSGNTRALDQIFPKIEVVTSIANQKNSKYAEHIFEFRPTSSSEGKGRVNLNQRKKMHIPSI